MGIVAIIPVANLTAANAALQSAGWGPNNFSVPAYASGNPTHAACHAWGPLALENAIKAQTGVTFNQSAGDPATRLRTLLSGVAQWGDDAPPLPTTGNALANTLYSYNSTELWWCIQTFSRTTFNLPPSNYPALIRRSRRPGEVLPWVQPTDQFDAYHAVNPFSGQPDRVAHAGKIWDCLIPNNVNTPGVANWREVVTSGFPAWLQPTGAGDVYPLGFRVTFSGRIYRSTVANNAAQPPTNWADEGPAA